MLQVKDGFDHRRYPVSRQFPAISIKVFDKRYFKRYYKIMNAKHRKTLAAILANPAPKALPFRDIESMLKGLGCIVKEREGSRVIFVKDRMPWATHRPHPDKMAREYQIKSVRAFLDELGITL